MTGNQLTIMHLSDLHFRCGQKFDRSVVLDPLLGRLADDLKKSITPEIIIISGDIAFSGKFEEYASASIFLTDLLKTCRLNKDRLFLIPGNHDVNREVYRPSDCPAYDTMQTLNTELENKEYRNDLFKGLYNYFSFIKDNYTHLTSDNRELVPFICPFTASCGKTIWLAGLNSAWMCRKANESEGKIAIGEYQVKKAFEELKSKGKTDITICVTHHPLSWLWEEDRRILRPYLNNTVLITGHLHQPEGMFSHDLEGMFYHFQAGGAYLEKGSSDPYPAQFHYITFDWKMNTITLDFRKYNKENRKWVLASEIANDGKRIFPGLGKSEYGEKDADSHKKRKIKSTGQSQFPEYMKYALRENRYIPSCGFETTFRHPIELEKVYINLRAHIGALEYTAKRKHDMERFWEREGLSSMDIKAAFSALKQYDIKDMVLLGDPGSGKTTLLKYILIMIARAKVEETVGLSSTLVPFFIPLRMWNPDIKDFYKLADKACLAGRFGITKQTFESLLKKGNALILFDGLDEAGDKSRRKKLIAWLEVLRKSYQETHFIFTSRFAGYTGTERLNSNILELSILDFTKDEIAAFLKGWFSAVKDALHPGDEQKQEKAKKEAENLIKRILASEQLTRFVKNPLILQITALVHRDRGTLPERRVELYDECTNVLLEKWDMAKGLEVTLTARQARQILQPLALWLHSQENRRSAPIDEIIEVMKEPLEEIGRQDADPKALLLNIRDRSGIFVGYSGDEYGFTHLSFQEYLAAEQIRNKSLISLLVKQYDNRWWREVILLCCGLTNPSIIDEFLEKLVCTRSFEDEVALACDAIHDSIIKPVAILEKALEDKELTVKTKCNILIMLKETGTKHAIKVIEDTVNGIEKELADFAARLIVECIDSTLFIIGKGIINIIKEKTGVPRTITNKKDNTEMVLVPAGPFLYGSKEDDKIASQDEKPQRVIELGAFYMDVFPVTNEKYCLFLNDVKPGEDTLEKWIELQVKWVSVKCMIIKKNKEYSVEPGYEMHPVINVSWFGSHAYARWAGKRLPTEQEWEKAARGTDGRIYPWGNKFRPDFCNVNYNIGSTTNVDCFPQGKSPYGFYDMAGNVWEWTSSFYSKDKNNYVLRGGAWNRPWDTCRCAARVYVQAVSSYHIGFRCARTV
jgi:formylglycine-generating enzyme required for sulfatase activity/predicted MPP superfamily phosphohydrolase